MDDFVHDSFSVEKLRKTYSGVFNPMTSKYFWPRVDLGYKIKKHKLRRKPGGPRKTRIKASDESGARKRKRCSECHQLGHTTKKCQGGLTAKKKKMFASHENASEVESNDSPTSSTRGRGTSSRSLTTGSSNDDASNIGGGSQTGRGGGTSSSRTETANDGATHDRG
ncbi:uncharacterized protein LOC120703745 isoform X2 [Panicum virgatum]|uniref:uncharacterized protein LOC120703745 isoform X2 n=1 Tax=Panicum virgatum TaxID=38727 RepID=UPI0019D53C01|nr:uncharacterized protein LOC120703745 isoform X2 [Panicum virgatum]